MQSIQKEQLFSNADELLQLAGEEMNRAREDLVTHLVCHNARQSILNYMQGFLLGRGVPIAEPATMANLLEQCRTQDARFRDLDLSTIHCRFEADHQDYCLHVDQVDECYALAQRTRSLVLG